jgi:hypothetical protein
MQTCKTGDHDLVLSKFLPETLHEESFFARRLFQIGKLANHLSDCFLSPNLPLGAIADGIVQALVTVDAKNLAVL